MHGKQRYPQHMIYQEYGQLCRDITESSYYKNRVFENIDFIVICFWSTKQKLNHIFFSFALKLLTAWKLILLHVCWWVAFRKPKEIKAVYEIWNVVVRFCDSTEELHTKPLYDFFSFEGAFSFKINIWVHFKQPVGCSIIQNRKASQLRLRKNDTEVQSAVCLSVPYLR